MAEHILIVEDNQKLANYLTEILQNKGYSVSHECRGDHAAFAIVQKQPDCVILDVMLPGLDGKAICHTVRPEYRGKILMLTAINDIENEVDCLNFGADDYITKPVSSELLLARLAALLRRPSKLDFTHLVSIGQLTLNFATHTACLSQIDIKLNPSEFELLALFVKNPDTLLSRNTITQALRGIDYDGVDRSIDLRIASLRKKFNDNLSNPQKIVTIHRKGYSFVSKAWG